MRRLADYPPTFRVNFTCGVALISHNYMQHFKQVN